MRALLLLTVNKIEMGKSRLVKVLVILSWFWMFFPLPIQGQVFLSSNDNLEDTVEEGLLKKNIQPFKFRENKLGLLGKNGWLVAPNSDAEWIGVGSEGLFPALKNGRYGYLDAAGKWIILPSFLEVGTFSEKFSSFRNTTNWGTINTEGKMVAEAKWDKINNFIGGVAIAESANKQYLILPDGELAYPEGLDKIERLKEGYYLAESNTKYGLLNAQGKLIIPITFDQIQVGGKDFFIVSKAGLSGIMKASGAMFLPLQYTHIAIDWTEQKVVAKSVTAPVEENLEPNPIKVSLSKRKKGV